MGVHIERKALVFREENRISFDSMVFIDLIRLEDAKVKLLSEWKKDGKNTEFFVSTKVINETFGVLVNRYNMDPIDVKEDIKKLKESLNIQELKYDKTIDNKQGFLLFEKYEKNYGSVDLDKHINDGRIIAHLKREGINIVYSREKIVRRLARIAGIEARNFILDKFHQKSQ